MYFLPHYSTVVTIRTTHILSQLRMYAFRNVLTTNSNSSSSPSSPPPPHPPIPCYLPVSGSSVHLLNVILPFASLSISLIVFPSVFPVLPSYHPTLQTAVTSLNMSYVLVLACSVFSVARPHRFRQTVRSSASAFSFQHLLFSFSHPVVAYVFFFVFPSVLSFVK